MKGERKTPYWLVLHECAYSNRISVYNWATHHHCAITKREGQKLWTDIPMNMLCKFDVGNDITVSVCILIIIPWIADEKHSIQLT